MILALACFALLLAPAEQLPMGGLGGGGPDGGSIIKYKPGHDGSGSGSKPTPPPDGAQPNGNGGPGGPSRSGPAAAARQPLGPTAPPRPPPSAVAATGGADLDALTGGELIEDWWIWWEINKSLYLVPPDEEIRRPVPMPWRTGTDGETQAQRSARAARALLPFLRTMLDDDSADVRAAAAIAWGRLGGDEAVDALLSVLSDPVQSVREAALLALGATGSPRASSLLLNVAVDGRVPGMHENIAPSARPLALVALAIARRHGMDESLDALVATLVDDASLELREAGLLYDALAGTKVCGNLVQDLAADQELGIRLRCRITEALPRYDAALLPAAMTELLASDPDRRRAAAATLAGADRTTALPRLDSAYAVEEEPLTRGFMLLSIGAQGGEQARDLLAALLRRGRAMDRPWVALALGLLARAGGDPVACEMLRDGLRDESSAQSLGAWILGCGLARDLQAGPALRAELVEASSPRDRMFAALSLSMLRDGESLAALRERFDQERSPLARAGVALGVALFERPEDAPRLAQELRDTHNPLLQSQLASALGLHDSPQAVAALQLLLAGPAADLPDAARAAAIEALGLLLDPYAGWRLVHAATGRNFAVFPDWLARALVTTTL